MFYDLFFYTSSEDEDEVNSELAFFTGACNMVIEASKLKISRTQVDMDRNGAHDRLVAAYFSEHPQYEATTFCTRLRMSRKLFTRIIREVTDHSTNFQQTPDCTRKIGFLHLMKCTSAICQMAYRAVPEALDEYL
nr:reverse transcriptase domain-containing protein [Tanacetum cinerariifolium]